MCENVNFDLSYLLTFKILCKKNLDRLNFGQKILVQNRLKRDFEFFGVIEK